MARDHYIPQVHLKNFSIDPEIGILNAVRKRDLFSFTPRSKDVCRIDEGNTNQYLKEPRAVEEFLKGIEHPYNRSVSKFRRDEIDDAAIYVISGFIAYVSTCSPAAIRLNTQPLKEDLYSVVQLLESEDRLPKAPPSLGGKTLRALLTEGVVESEIQPKFPQALGISTIQSLLFTIGNFCWDILHNPFPETFPFFTSDYPVAIENQNSNNLLNKIVPLAPDIAIRIRPTPGFDTQNVPHNFSEFRFRKIVLNQNEVMEINQLIVRCAESQVFFRHEHVWIPEFLKNNAQFRVESVSQKLKFGRGFLRKSSLTIASISNQS